MKRRYKIILSVVILGSMLFYYYNYSYVVFEPISYDRTFENKIKIPVDSGFYQRLAFVLEKSGFRYKVNKSGKVLIERRLSRDEDLVYTFTKKSMDSIWIKQHLSGK